MCWPSPSSSTSHRPPVANTWQYPSSSLTEWRPSDMHYDIPPVWHRTALFHLQESRCCPKVTRDLKSYCIQLIIWHLIHHHRISAKGSFSLSLGPELHYLSRHVPRVSLSLLDPISLISSLTTSTPAISDFFIVACALHAHSCHRVFALAFSSTGNAILPYTHMSCSLAFFMSLSKCHLLNEAFPDHLILNCPISTFIPNILSSLMA